MACYDPGPNRAPTGSLEGREACRVCVDSGRFEPSAADEECVDCGDPMCGYHYTIQNGLCAGCYGNWMQEGSSRAAALRRAFG